MADIFPFTPSTNAVFQFQPTFDGQIYTVLVPWNYFGKRFYVQCLSLDNELIFYKALAGSPIGFDISLTYSFFTTKLVFRTPNQQFEVI